MLHVAGGCWSCASQPELAGLAGPGVSCTATAGCARLLQSEHCSDQTSSVAVLAPLLQIVGTAVIDATWALGIKKASPLFADCSVLSCAPLRCTAGVSPGSGQHEGTPEGTSCILLGCKSETSSALMVLN